MSIVVGPVAIPAVVDRPEIVVTIGDNEVWLDEFNRWASPLGRRHRARHRGESERAACDARASRCSRRRRRSMPTTRVAIEVQRFESVPGIARARSTRVYTRAARAGRRVGRPAARPCAKRPTDKCYDALAAAHSRAVARLARDIATPCARSPRNPPRPPLLQRADYRHPYGRTPCAASSTRNDNPWLAWVGLRARSSSRCWCCRSRWPRSARRGCASPTSRSSTCSWRSASTSSSASRACSTWATSRSTRWGRTCTRCSRARTSTCTCRSGSSCRSAPRSPACSACCSAHRRSSCAATTSRSSRWASARSSASSSTTCRSRSTSPTARRASR